MDYWAPPDTHVLLIILIVAVLGALGLLVVFPFSLALIVRTQRWIEHLDFKYARIGHLSQFSVCVEFETPEGPRVVSAHMESDAERVPLQGEPLLAIVAAARGPRTPEWMLNEPDPERPMRFDPDGAKYVVTADGGGG